MTKHYDPKAAYEWRESVLSWKPSTLMGTAMDTITDMVIMP